MKIQLTKPNGDPIEVEADHVRGLTGGHGGCHIYNMADGSKITVKESIAEFRALKASGGNVETPKRNVEVNEDVDIM